MRGLGIDQAMEGPAGYAVYDFVSNCVLATGIETYKQDRADNLVPRTRYIPDDEFRWHLNRFGIFVRELVDLWKPDIVITELVRTHHHGRRDPVVMMSLYAALTTLCLVVQRPRPIVAMNTGTWQAAELHPKRGEDTKELSRAFVQKHYGLVVTEHEADAVCMCRAYPIVKDNPEVNTNPRCIRWIR